MLIAAANQFSQTLETDFSIQITSNPAYASVCLHQVHDIRSLHVGPCQFRILTIITELGILLRLLIFLFPYLAYASTFPILPCPTSPLLEPNISLPFLKLKQFFICTNDCPQKGRFKPSILSVFTGGFVKLYFSTFSYL